MERLDGIFPDQCWADELIARALMWVVKANGNERLAGAVLEQLYLNYASAGRADKADTWAGALVLATRRAHPAWGRFDIALRGDGAVGVLAVRGIPGVVEPTIVMVSNFRADVRAGRVHGRLSRCWAAELGRHQQEVLLRELVRACWPRGLQQEREPGVVFPALPRANLARFRALVRFVLGLAGLARTVAHRGILAPLRDELLAIGGSGATRACVRCLLERREVHVESEWHFIFDCDYTQRSRACFFQSVGFDGNVQQPARVREAVGLLLHVRDSPNALGALAAYLSSSLHIRRSWLKETGLASRLRALRGEAVLCGELTRLE